MQTCAIHPLNEYYHSIHCKLYETVVLCAWALFLSVFVCECWLSKTTSHPYPMEDVLTTLCAWVLVPNKTWLFDHTMLISFYMLTHIEVNLRDAQSQTITFQHSPSLPLPCFHLTHKHTHTHTIRLLHAKLKENICRSVVRWANEWTCLMKIMKSIWALWLDLSIPTTIDIYWPGFRFIHLLLCLTRAGEAW